ncbi:MAG: GNAT family N-acetyltransferase, partial [Actinomyces sp.]|nr:GNAT family N-acetyltransferase [Actinomyces sp.]
MAQEFFTEVFNACALPAAHPLRAQVLTQTRQMWEETLAGN